MDTSLNFSETNASGTETAKYGHSILILQEDIKNIIVKIYNASTATKAYLYLATTATTGTLLLTTDIKNKIVHLPYNYQYNKTYFIVFDNGGASYTKCNGVSGYPIESADIRAIGYVVYGSSSGTSIQQNTESLVTQRTIISTSGTAYLRTDYPERDTESPYLIAENDLMSENDKVGLY